MDSSKASNVAKGTRALENTGEETVTDIISMEVERDIEHVLVTSDEQNDPCCSGTQPAASATPLSHPPISTPPLATHSSPATSPPPIIPPTTTIPLHPSRSSPPELQATTARTRGPHLISMSDVAIFPPHGPPPSYSKSLLDRRINPCASIQFVAPIPPPSYEGYDSELRYSDAAGYSGFTLGLGNTWQSQPQPAYCPVCETVIITRVAVKTSRIAHIFAIILFLLLCWPFCLLPYIINACNHTIHHCSVCRSMLGARAPFQRS